MRTAPAAVVGPAAIAKQFGITRAQVQRIAAAAKQSAAGSPAVGPGGHRRNALGHPRDPGGKRTK